MPSASPVHSGRRSSRLKLGLPRVSTTIGLYRCTPTSANTRASTAIASSSAASAGGGAQCQPGGADERAGRDGVRERDRERVEEQQAAERRRRVHAPAILPSV